MVEDEFIGSCGGHFRGDAAALMFKIDPAGELDPECKVQESESVRVDLYLLLKRHGQDIILS